MLKDKGLGCGQKLGQEFWECAWVRRECYSQTLAELLPSSDTHLSLSFPFTHQFHYFRPGVGLGGLL